MLDPNVILSQTIKQLDDAKKEIDQTIAVLLGLVGARAPKKRGRPKKNPLAVNLAVMPVPEPTAPVRPARKTNKSRKPLTEKQKQHLSKVMHDKWVAKQKGKKAKAKKAAA
jgi:hypothetical protein